MLRAVEKAVGTTAVSLKDFLGLDERAGYKVLLQAPSGNASALLLGSEASQPYELAAGGELELAISNTKDLFLLGQNGTDTVRALCFFGTIR